MYTFDNKRMHFNGFSEVFNALEEYLHGPSSNPGEGGKKFSPSYIAMFTWRDTALVIDINN